jgi:hypothetical protein
VLKISSKYGQRYFARPYSSFSSQVPYAVLVDYSAVGMPEALVNESGVFPVNIISPWLSMLEHHLKDEH